LRDAGRHRGRSAPAGAAIMAAVAGSMALTVYLVALDDHDRRTYTYVARPGQAIVSLFGYNGGKGNEPTRIDAGPIRDAVSDAMPVRDSIVVNSLSPAFCTIAAPCTQVSVVPPAASACPLDEIAERAGELPKADVLRYRNDPRCKSYFGGGPAMEGGHFGIPVGGPELLRALTGKSSAEAEAALAAGGMVVFDPSLVSSGKSALRVSSDDGAQHTVTLPAAYLSVPIVVAPAVVAPAALSSLGQGVEAEPMQLLFTMNRMPTEQEEDRARATIDATGEEAYLQVERGYVSDYGPGLLALLIGSAVITLGAAGIATGLAQADARPDHATLAAVGAPPAVRRKLSMFQAAVIAVLGTLLGIAAGFVPVSAYLRAVPDMRIIIPWTALAVTLIGVPLLAALCAGLFTRSRVPMERRIA
jgi:putative ABC transport system permease protein